MECAFGILANKWRFLHSPISLSMEYAIGAVQAACALHNFVRARDGYLFEDSLMHELEDPTWIRTHGNCSGENVRQDFTEYFMSANGQLSWQLDAIG